MYRFQYLTEFNQHTIDDRDRKIARMNFHVFDRLLSMDIVSIPQTSSENKQGEKKVEGNAEQVKIELKQKMKINTEVSKLFVDKLFYE